MAPTNFPSGESGIPDVLSCLPCDSREWDAHGPTCKRMKMPSGDIFLNFTFSWSHLKIAVMTNNAISKISYA